jgi:hypothetical protein
MLRGLISQRASSAKSKKARRIGYLVNYWPDASRLVQPVATPTAHVNDREWEEDHDKETALRLG